jgi:hypothetical protein
MEGKLRSKVFMRSLPLALIFVVFGFQAGYGYFALQERPLYLFWPTLALLTPAIWWTLEGFVRASSVYSLIMLAIIAGANKFGEYGYVSAFWLGLPIGMLVAWKFRTPKNRTIR